MDDFLRTTLGSTGRVVHRLGVASSFGIGGADLEALVEEHGLSYLYWGSLRRGGFGEAIRALTRRGLRDQLFVVVQSYSRLGSLVRPSLNRALKRLGLDHADLLLLGMWNKPVSGRVLDAALRCKALGLTRHVGLSTHQRLLVPGFAQADTPYDVVHFRYNAAHRGAEEEIFPHLPPAPRRSGLVAFTALSWRRLLERPRGAPSDLPIPTAGDCYRFVLSNPSVDVCMTGPRSGDDLRHALEALRRGPMDEDELTWMRAFGDAVYKA